MKTRRLLLAATAFSNLLMDANPALAQDWALAGVPGTNCMSVASSADGTKLVAAGGYHSGPIYTSTDSGATWTSTSAPSLHWWSVASSADGSKLVAAAGGPVNYGNTGPIYTSTDSGVSWAVSGAPTANWTSVACSADGTKLVAAATFGIFTSTDSGTTWRANYVSQYNGFTSVASSTDGTKLVAVDNDYYDSGIYTSTNSGANWTESPAPFEGWDSVASSADGVKLAAAGSGVIYASSDSGTTWRQTSAPGKYWTSIASSADGNELIAAGYSYVNNLIIGSIYTSVNSGTTWKSNAVPNLYWLAVASSADGTKLVAMNGGGGIYTWAATIPVISTQPGSQTVLAGTNITFSVDVFGVPPLFYQWQFEGTHLLNATNSTLILTNVKVSDLGFYALLVTNSFGGALSSNALLTVLPALVTTQPATAVSASAALLNGLVTPGANDTAVWFEWWGTDAEGHATLATTVGASSSQLTFNSQITGLAPTTVYHYHAVASNDLGIVVGDERWFLTAVTPFTQTTAPVTNWTSVASSADGTKLVAAGGTPKWGTSDSGSIYVSADSGITWILTSAPYTNWTSVASSADGTKLVGVASPGGIYISTNSGITWMKAIGLTSWTGVASSADGSKLVAVRGRIYTSTNSGASWKQTSAPITEAFSCVASSADGSKLVAGAFYDLNSNPGQIYISTNSGATWTASGAPANVWFSVASSADGSRLIAASAEPYFNTSTLYLSTNSGATWTTVNSSVISTRVICVASSADGIRLVAAGNQGQFFISADSGATWGPSAPADNWQCVASSADGAKLVAVAYGGGNYTLQTTPRPMLSLTPSGANALLSWIIPSLAFTLQQSSDLTTTNWTDVPTPPVLNLTNLQNQVTVSSTNPAGYYRLKH